MPSQYVYASGLIRNDLVISDEQDKSSVLDCTHVIDDQDTGHGAAAVRRLIVSETFPTCVITFLVGDTNVVASMVSHGTIDANGDAGEISINYVQGVSPRSLSLPAWWLDAIHYLVVNTSVVMPQDETISLYTQPLYQVYT